jgi:hypothetical protein
MEERQTEACPVSLSLIFKKYTELHWTKLRLKYTCTNGYYLNILRTESMGNCGAYFFEFFARFPQCLPMQNAQIPLQFKHCVQNLTICAQFTISLRQRAFSFILFCKHKLNVFENSRWPQTKLLRTAVCCHSCN